MTNKKENQSQNQQNNKKLCQVRIVESLLDFHAALEDVNTAFDKLFEQLKVNAIQLQKIKNKLAPGAMLWQLDKLEHELPMILLSAGVLENPQYLQFDENCIVKICKPE